VNIKGIWKSRSQKGFTLVELLVVISIIGVLATLVLLQLGTARARARDTKRITDVNQIRTAVESYFEDNGGKYPSAATWETDIAKYLTRVPTDPLDATHHYIYKVSAAGGAFQVAAELESTATALGNDADLKPADFAEAIDGSKETCANKDINDNECVYDQGVKP
jgi:prepilin-type N-terminal cleavage/methylation domain-containing protein